MATQTRRPRGGIGITMRGNKYEATYSIPKADLPAGVGRKRVTAHGDTELLAVSALLAKLQTDHINRPQPEALTDQQEAETRAALGPDGKDIKGSKNAKYDDDKGPLLSDWAEEWLTDWTSDIQDSTRSIYKGHINTYILDYLGKYHLNELSAKVLKKEWWEPIGKLPKIRGGVETDEPLLGNFARANVYKTLRMVLTTAHHKLGTRVSLTEKLISIPEGERPESDREIAAATKHLINLMVTNPDKDDPRWPLFTLSLLGLRQAERLGLRVSDIHLENPEDQYIKVSKQLAHSTEKSWYIKDATKNGKSREIPVFGIFIEALEKQLEMRARWAAQDDWNPDPKFADLLFLQEGGKLWTRRKDTPAWHEYVGSDMEMRGHLTRHATGTILAENGVSSDVAKVILGHKSDVYAMYYRTVSTEHIRKELKQGFKKLSKK